MMSNTFNGGSIDQSQPFNIDDYLRFIPGIYLLIPFMYGGKGTLIAGAIVLSIIYGLVGAIMGGVYGKIKNRNKVV